MTTYATLRPEIEPGTVTWLDVMMTIPCGCNTAMVTFWVTPLDITQTIENHNLDISLFPNPTSDFITIEAEGLRQVTLMDMSGKTLKRITTNGNTQRMDLSGLPSGMYFIIANTENGQKKQSVIKR